MLDFLIIKTGKEVYTIYMVSATEIPPTRRLIFLFGYGLNISHDYEDLVLEGKKQLQYRFSSIGS